MHKHAHTHRQARIWMHTLGAHIFAFSTSISHSSPHMNALKAVHPQDSGWPVEITLSHLKTIIIAGWQNAAIYTKRTWLLNTFSASLTQRRLVCQLVKTVYPPKQPTNQPIKTFFYPPGQSLVWFVLSVSLQNPKWWWWGAPCDRHTSQYPPGRKRRLETEKTGCPLLMSPLLDLLWLLKSSLGVNVDWCMTATEGFHPSKQERRKLNPSSFCESKIHINTSPTTRFGFLLMSMLILRV